MINGRLCLHAHIYNAITKASIKHYQAALNALEDNLRTRGVKELFTYVSSLGKYRFAEFFGFKTCYQTFNISGTDFEIMSKEL